MSRVVKLVSGGQTGADRAALDVALELKILCGGWCPCGRRAEDGPLADRYPLLETLSDAYEQRTNWNVRDSDGTLVVTRGQPSGGTAYTIKTAEKYGKPHLIVDVEGLRVPEDAAARVIRWLKEWEIQVLNIAGPRASKDRNIYQDVRTILLEVLKPLFSQNTQK